MYLIDHSDSKEILPPTVRLQLGFMRLCWMSLQDDLVRTIKTKLYRLMWLQNLANFSKIFPMRVYVCMRPSESVRV